MPITPTYPGLYIEELPSNAHTITAAATSITVFVGYTHPFKTRSFGTAVLLFSFTDYEREFGGLYASAIVEHDVAYAVNQFFLNGGSVAYVIGLNPQTLDKNGAVVLPGPIPQATATVGNIVFTAREPADVIPMKVTVNNLKATVPLGNLDIADITIAYGTQAETYRAVTIAGDTKAPNYIDNRFKDPGSGLLLSGLVTVASTGGGYGTTITPADHQPFVITLPAGFATTFSEKDFIDVFQQDRAIDKIPIFNLLAIPGVADNAVWSAALSFCEGKRAFVILDPPEQAAADSSTPKLPAIGDIIADQKLPTSVNGALYFPYLLSLDPLTGNPIELPPSGFVAGIFARTDLNRGVWKAPAGLETIINNTIGVVARGRMTDQRQGTLNPVGVNCIRTFPNAGTVVFGARTQVTANPSFQQWRYVPVRRMALFIEQTLLMNLGWAVFEPNDNPLWVALRTTVENFMLSLFNQGAFQGSTPSKAFRVTCDGTTTTQQDIDNGVVNIIVAFAPLKPAEFVIIKIAQLAGQTQA
ncbi:MAG TPA: phage tail sheath subtilisin-like domain-containing protein [Bryobacteraceae bacterium]